MTSKEIFKKYISRKLKFASSSLVATLTDYAVFMLLTFWSVELILASIISVIMGMSVNFYLQKKYIFHSKRAEKAIIGLFIVFSFAGILLNTVIFATLLRVAPFSSFPLLAKIAATCSVFFFNYYSKRLVFEKR